MSSELLQLLFLLLYPCHLAFYGGKMDAVSPLSPVSRNNGKEQKAKILEELASCLFLLESFLISRPEGSLERGVFYVSGLNRR